MWWPQLWFSQYVVLGEGAERAETAASAIDATTVRAEHPLLGNATLYAEPAGGMLPKLLFTENETNVAVSESAGNRSFQGCLPRPLWRATRQAVIRTSAAPKSAFTHAAYPRR